MGNCSAQVPWSAEVVTVGSQGKASERHGEQGCGHARASVLNRTANLRERIQAARTSPDWTPVAHINLRSKRRWDRPSSHSSSWLLRKERVEKLQELYAWRSTNVRQWELTVQHAWLSTIWVAFASEGSRVEAKDWSHCRGFIQQGRKER